MGKQKQTAKYEEKFVKCELYIKCTSFATGHGHRVHTIRRALVRQVEV